MLEAGAAQERGPQTKTYRGLNKETPVLIVGILGGDPALQKQGALRTPSSFR